MNTAMSPGPLRAAGHVSLDEVTDDPRPLAELRAETCATLTALDAAAKARASIVRSCTEASGLPVAELAGLKDLLRCITDQRKRLRAVRRLWQSLDSYERPSAELVEATALCISECREVALALEPWREHSLDQVTRNVSLTWQRLADAASRFTGAAASPSPLPTRRATHAGL
jgi:hypothetical protein